MMIVIAEISDKMITIPWQWGSMAILSLPFFIGLSHRWVAWLLMFVALVFSLPLAYSFYHEAYIEAGMKEAIWNEMGTLWVVSSISSAFLPLIVATAVLIWMIKKKETQQSGGE